MTTPHLVGPSVSFSVRRRHTYFNGFKVVGYTYTNDVEGPMPANTFVDVAFGGNLCGFYTDINMFAQLFNEKEMISWTSSCTQLTGEIFD